MDNIFFTSSKIFATTPLSGKDLTSSLGLILLNNKAIVFGKQLKNQPANFPKTAGFRFKSVELQCRLRNSLNTALQGVKEKRQQQTFLGGATYCLKVSRSDESITTFSEPTLSYFLKTLGGKGGVIGALKV